MFDAEYFKSYSLPIFKDVGTNSTVEPLEAIKFQNDMLMPLPSAVGVGCGVKIFSLGIIQMACHIVNVTLLIVLWRKESLGSIEISTADQKANSVTDLAENLSCFQQGFGEIE